jgi:error-prone DNA polymerase
MTFTRDLDAVGLLTSAGARKEKARQRSWRPPASRHDGRKYIELHARSSFSFLDGASLPEDLIQEAAEQQLPAVALVDTNGVYGAPRFYGAAKKAGLRALVGAEIVLDEDWRTPETALPAEAPAKLRLVDDTERRRLHSLEPRLTLLVGNREGYRNLCRLLTAGALRNPKGEARFRWSEIAAHAEGLHLLTGSDEGAVARLLREDGYAGTKRFLERIAAMFPGRTHLELQRHRRVEEEHRNQALMSIARSSGLPLVITNGVRHARTADKELLDVLTCIKHGVSLDKAGRLLSANRERHLKHAGRMSDLFADLPDVLDSTWELGSRLDFTLADLGYQFPEYPLPEGETPQSYLRQITWNGARMRFRPLTAKAQAQIEKELNMIEKLDLAGYFLIVRDIVQFCLKNGILVQGRGSAANSAVCYALSITAIDPVKMELLFERFLSEERGEWPDIDLDLPSGDQREKVIQYVYQRYGVRGAAMTANVITYREKSAAREVGKALGLAPDQVYRFAKQIGRWTFGEIREKLEELPAELAQAGLDPQERRVREMLRLWLRIQNLPRHLGQHSGGMVMAKGRLDEVVPLEPASMPGRVVVQWDKDDCADLGIIKVDLLGLGMLDAIEKALPMIRDHEEIDLDLAHLPQDDPKVFSMLNEADTIGVFQVESRAQMASLPRNAPKTFYDLVVQVAIIRPGPIVGGMVNPFFARRQGKIPVEYAHPCLEPILKRTLGVPLFQEQLLKMAMVVSGFTGGEAEELRRAMGFKRSMERMIDIERRLRDGMNERAITGAAQDQIVKSITSFALYGFPESHAASFALIAYASAYIKAHHPAAFFASLLNAWPMGFYHPASLVKDAQRHGVTMHPIDVNHSGWYCRWEDGGVRMGLRYVKGLREATGKRIEQEAAARPFSSIDDLAARCSIRKDQFDKLAWSGALASLGLTRRAAAWQASRVARNAGSLFRSVEERSDSPLDEMTALDETLADYRSSDLTTGPHLLQHFRDSLERDNVVSAADLRRLPDGRRVATAGAVVVRQRPGTAKGFVFLTLEDETGMSQAIVNPNLFREQRALIVGSSGLIVEGILQNSNEGQPSVRAERFFPLEQAFEMKSHDFH